MIVNNKQQVFENVKEPVKQFFKYFKTVMKI